MCSSIDERVEHSPLLPKVVVFNCSWPSPPSSIIGIIAGNGIYPDTFIAHARKAG